jgi:hypothetical protein
MRSNVIATYTHTDSEVRFLMRYTFATAFFSGAAIAGVCMKLFA